MALKRISLVVLLLTLAGAAAFARFYLFSAKSETLAAGPTSQTLVTVPPETILHEIKEHQAALTLVNFWATWCEPCKIEFPAILEVYRSFRDQGLNLVLVSLDDTDSFTEAEKFLAFNQVDFKSYFKGQQSLNMVAKMAPKWSGAIPASMLLGPNSEILDYWEGDTQKKELIERVTRHLPKN